MVICISVGVELRECGAMTQSLGEAYAGWWRFCCQVNEWGKTPQGPEAAPLRYVDAFNARFIVASNNSEPNKLSAKSVTSRDEDNVSRRYFVSELIADALMVRPPSHEGGASQDRGSPPS